MSVFRCVKCNANYDYKENYIVGGVCIAPHHIQTFHGQADACRGKIQELNEGPCPDCGMFKSGSACGCELPPKTEHPKCHMTPMSFQAGEYDEQWWECYHCGHTKLIQPPNAGER